MIRLATTLLGLSAASHALPHQFQAGAPARASELNDNFHSLDTALTRKADLSLVNALGTAIATKADSSTLAGLRTKIRQDSAALGKEIAKAQDRTWVDSLATRVDTGTFRRRLQEQSDALEAVKNASAPKFPGPAGSLARFDGNGALEESGLVDDGSRIAASRILAAPYFQGTLAFTDTRDSATVPSAMVPGTRFQFKHCFVEGISDAQYCGEMTYRPWGDGSDFSGGPVHQLAFSQSGRIWHRTGSDGTWSEWMRLAYDGQVLASSGGTVAGDLHVAGRLTTSPLEPVADYVFDPGYRLAPLAEVEAYTKEHRHLPEIPDAQAVAKGGLDLGQMNILLLKKVEELTLHAIRQEKALEEQAKINEELRRSLAEIQSSLGR